MKLIKKLFGYSVAIITAFAFSFQTYFATDVFSVQPNAFFLYNG